MHFIASSPTSIAYLTRTMPNFHGWNVVIDAYHYALQFLRGNKGLISPRSLFSSWAPNSGTFFSINLCVCVLRDWGFVWRCVCVCECVCVCVYVWVCVCGLGVWLFGFYSVFCLVLRFFLSLEIVDRIEIEIKISPSRYDWCLSRISFNLRSCIIGKTFR